MVMFNTDQKQPASMALSTVGGMEVATLCLPNLVYLGGIGLLESSN